MAKKPAKSKVVALKQSAAIVNPQDRIDFLLSVIKAREAEIDALRIALRNSHPGVWAEFKHWYSRQGE